ncbi:UNVERIFIED_CONTAM: sushi domain (scr repeat) domain-containing protein [Hammondia hammondi]|eukprot:XP_008881730.1 sushi domain (scr repeat) domain-containing protein [Hammondia hammondi]
MYRFRPGVGCELLPFAERVVDAWCSKDASGNFCFSEVEETLASLEGPGHLAAKPSDELEETCSPNSCYMKHIRYLDAITQLQVAWKLLGDPRGFFRPDESRPALSKGIIHGDANAERQASRQKGNNAQGRSLRRLQRPEADGEGATQTLYGGSERAGITAEKARKEGDERRPGNTNIKKDAEEEGHAEDAEDEEGFDGQEEAEGEEKAEPKVASEASLFSLRSSVARRLASRPRASTFSSSASPLEDLSHKPLASEKFKFNSSSSSEASSPPASRAWLEALETHATRRDRAYHSLARRLQHSVATATDILGIPLEGSFFSESASSSRKTPFSSEESSAEPRASPPDSPTHDFSSPRDPSPSSSPSSLSSSPRSSSSRRPRRLQGLEPRLAAHFDGPLGESLEELVTLMCTKVEGDFCQQTLVLLAEESPVKNPTLVIQPCSSRCFVPITGLLGSLVESYGARYDDPFHRALGQIMRAYGRFYCTYNEAGQVCGEMLFNKLKHVDIPAFTPQGLDVNFSQCACPHSFLQDGQCDRACFNEACGWDGQDCFVRRMFPEIYEALLSLVSPQCSAFSASFECTAKCKRQYEHLLLPEKNCCMAAGFELLSSLLAIDVEHPLFDAEAWAPSRSLAFLEYQCDFSLDRTCSLGRPRQQVVISTSLAGVDARRLLADAPKLRDVEQVVRKTAAQKLALVDQDLARILSRPAPGGLQLLAFIDAGVYTDRTLLAIQNQMTLRQMDEAILRRLGAVALDAYRDFEHKSPLAVETSPLPLTRTVTSPAVSSSSPPLPFAGTWGVHELPVDLPKEGCSVSDLHRLLHPGYSLTFLSPTSFASRSPAAPMLSSPTARGSGQGGERPLGATGPFEARGGPWGLEEGDETAALARGGGKPGAVGDGPLPAASLAFPALTGKSTRGDSRRLFTPKRRRLAAFSPSSRSSRASSPSPSLSSSSLSSVSSSSVPSSVSASSLVARRLQEGSLSLFSSPESGMSSGISSGGQRAWYSHGEGEAVECASPLYFPVSGPTVDRVVCDNGSWTFKNLLVCKRNCPRAAELFASQASSSFSSSSSSLPSPSSSPSSSLSPSPPASEKVSPYRVLGGDAVSHGSVVSVACEQGFSPAGLQVSPSRFECIDSQWVGRPLVCSPLCPAFPVLGAAYVVAGEGREDGDRRLVACARGFYPQHRSFTSVCQGSRWSPLLFECTQATPPDMQEGATGLQKILLQMFSREGVLGLVIFSVLVTLAAVAVFIAWRLHYKARATQNFIAREETVQALKVSSLPPGAGETPGDSEVDRRVEQQADNSSAWCAAPGGPRGRPRSAWRGCGDAGFSDEAERDGGEEDRTTDGNGEELSAGKRCGLSGPGGVPGEVRPSICPSYLGSAVGSESHAAATSRRPGSVEKSFPRSHERAEGGASVASVSVRTEFQASTHSARASGGFSSSGAVDGILSREHTGPSRQAKGPPESHTAALSPRQLHSAPQSGAARVPVCLEASAAPRASEERGDAEMRRHPALASSGNRRQATESEVSPSLCFPPREGAFFGASICGSSVTENSMLAAVEAPVHSLPLYHKLHAERMQRPFGGRGGGAAEAALESGREETALERQGETAGVSAASPQVSREEKKRRERDEGADEGRREGRRFQRESQFAASFSLCGTISEADENGERSTQSLGASGCRRRDPSSTAVRSFHPTETGAETQAEAEEAKKEHKGEESHEEVATPGGDRERESRHGEDGTRGGKGE